MNQPIDFAAVAERADLPAIMARCSPPIEVRNGKALCPFHANRNTPAMTVFQIGGRWRFECKSCGAKGDAITFLADYNRITKVEAAKEIGGIVDARMPGKGPGVLQGRSPGPRWVDGPPSPRGTQDGAYRRPGEATPEWVDPGWQEEADRIIRQAEARLWSSEGSAALGWLRARGLADHTIRQFRLGFVAEFERGRPLEVLAERGHPRPITARRGITIPWVHPESWYDRNEEATGPRWVGCNVRRLAPDPRDPLPDTEDKCRAFAGSKRGYPYPAADLVPGLPALILEGEWDALIAWQELGWIVNVVAVGGAKQEPRPEAMATLDDCPDWLLALHNDDAGNAGARKWSGRARGKDVRLILPAGVDVNDMHRRGDDLRAWLRSEYEDLGWAWPLAR